MISGPDSLCKMVALAFLELGKQADVGGCWWPCVELKIVLVRFGKVFNSLGKDIWLQSSSWQSVRS